MGEVDLVVSDDKKESYVGKKLNDSTTKKIIILVLFLIFSFPIFSLKTYIDEPEGFNSGLELLSRLKDTNSNPNRREKFFKTVVEYQQNDLYKPLIYAEFKQ